ncbi:DUF397 domain-containing protein [Streptomyces sp. NPDC102360]|uniref:DUF397 domain-containing protein n=1 Tax=Streptomyces sp. NPDC102360 TaxID=3366160 RepID=UPI0038299BDC
MDTATWRKSSYSGSNGGECIECAALDGATWQKSSYSGSSGGDCLEVAAPTPTGAVAIRDSKDPGLGHLRVTPRAFSAFVAGVVRGQA